MGYYGLRLVLAAGGACCKSEEPLCVDGISAEECTGGGGTFAGVGTVCTNPVACCFPDEPVMDDTCEDLAPVCCRLREGITHPKAACTDQDDDSNGVDDTCDVDPIPTVSEWGLAAMTLLVLAAGTVVIRRRAAA